MASGAYEGGGRRLFDPPVVHGGDAGTPYVFTQDVTLAVNVALATGRPLLVDGPPGSGKTTLARAVAEVLGRRYHEYRVTRATSTQDLLYRFDADRRLADAQVARIAPRDDAYLEPGVLWWAFDPPSPGDVGGVVLVDDVDRGPADLAPELLSVWAAGSFLVRETGTVVRRTAEALLVVTLSGERPVPDQLRRRFVTVAMAPPSAETLLRIAAAHGLDRDPGIVRRVVEILLQAHYSAGVPLDVARFLDMLRATSELRLEPGGEEWWAVLGPRPEPERAAVPEPAPQRQCRVFLCHSSGDKPRVRDLYEQLRAEGFDPWLDAVNLLPGQDWEYEIRRAVRAADLVLVCLSAGSVAKTGFVQREIRMVLDLADEQPEGKTYLIPVRLEPCDVPERLRRWQWVDLHQPEGYGRLLAALWDAAERLDLAAVGSQVSPSR